VGSLIEPFWRGAEVEGTARYPFRSSEIFPPFPISWMREGRGPLFARPFPFFSLELFLVVRHADVLWARARREPGDFEHGALSPFPTFSLFLSLFPPFPGDEDCCWGGRRLLEAEPERTWLTMPFSFPWSLPLEFHLRFTPPTKLFHRRDHMVEVGGVRIAIFLFFPRSRQSLSLFPIR